MVSRLLTKDDIERSRIRQYDDSGLLIKAGFTWQSPRIGNIQGGAFFAGLGLLVIVGGGIFAFVAGFLAIVPIAIGALIIYFSTKAKKTIACGVHLSIDGTIEYLDKNGTWFKDQHSTNDIHAFFEKPTPDVKGGQYRFRVANWDDGYPSNDLYIDFHDALNYAVSTLLTDHDVKIIAIQLNQALEEIRVASRYHTSDENDDDLSAEDALKMVQQAMKNASN